MPPAEQIAGAQFQQVSYTNDGNVWQLKTDSILVPLQKKTLGYKPSIFQVKRQLLIIQTSK